LRSIGVDLFQMLDLMLGAAAYDHKIACGLVKKAGARGNPKARLLNHIKDRLEIETFVGDVKTARLNVKHFGRVALAA